MKFASLRLIARDIKAVVGFYEEVTGKGRIGSHRSSLRS